MRSRAVRPAAGHDSVGVAPLLTDLDFAALLADKAFDSDGFRTELDNRGAVAVIPPKANRVTPIPCDFEIYKWRHLVETSSARSRSSAASPLVTTKQTRASRR